jgi:hypothetical protein
MLITDRSPCKSLPALPPHDRLRRGWTWAGLLVLGLGSACCIWRTHRRRSHEA